MRTFLKLAAFSLLALVILTIALRTYILNLKKEECVVLAESLKKISNQLILSHLQVSGIEVNGRLENHSNQELPGFKLEVAAEDCLDGSCIMVAKHTFSIGIAIPPREARDFREMELLNNQLASIQRRGEIRFTANATPNIPNCSNPNSYY